VILTGFSSPRDLEGGGTQPPRRRFELGGPEGGAESLGMRDARRHLQSVAPGLEGAMRLLGYWQR